MTLRRPHLLALVPLLLFAWGVAIPSARASTIEEAELEIDGLKTFVGKSRSSNEDILGAIDAVLNVYKNLVPPEAPTLVVIPEDADEDTRKEMEKENTKREREHERAMKDYDKDAEDFREDAIKLFGKALSLEKIDRGTETNVRTDVNVAAARALAETGHEDATREVRKALEKTILKAKYSVSQLLLDEAFLALAKLNEMDSLEWMVKEFTHTKSSPVEEVDQLLSAHKAMVQFQQVPGMLRYEIVKEMVKSYTPVETAADTGTAETQSQKQFWDRIKNDAIKVVQRYAGDSAVDENGQAIATMANFSDWFRDHKNARRAPWDEDEAAAEQPDSPR